MARGNQVSIAILFVRLTDYSMTYPIISSHDRDNGAGVAVWGAVKTDRGGGLYLLKPS